MYVIILTLTTLATALSQDGNDGRVIIGDTTGVSLEAVGFLLGKEGNHYRSIFLKILDPTGVTDVCRKICRENMEKAMRTWIDKRATVCDSTWKRGKHSAPELRRTNSKSGFECLRECLMDEDCFQVGVRDKQCILRPRELGPEEMEIGQEEQTEYKLNCIMGTTRRRQMCEDIARVSNETLILKIDEANRKFINDTWTELNTMNPEEKRQKRDIQNWLFGGGISMSMLTAGYDLWETKKLKKHVDELNHRFVEFQKEQNKFNRQQVFFNKKVLQVSRKMEMRWEIQECKNDRMIWEMLDQRRLLEWKNYLQQVYDGTLGGSRVGSISPVIFPKEYMETLIRDDIVLASTVYKDKVDLAYKLGLLSVVGHSKERGQFNIHVVLGLPDLGATGIREVYRVLQTGVVLNGTKCGKLNLPFTVYEEEDKFYEMESSICDTKSNLHLCWGGSGAGRREVHCLTNKEECKLDLEKCSTQVRETRAGVQIRTLEQVRAKERENPNYWITVDMGNTRTRFFNRSKYSAVMVGDYERKMTDEELKVQINTLPDPEEWNQLMEDRWLTYQRENLTVLAETVQKQHQIVNQITESMRRKDKGEWKKYMLIGAITAGTILIAGGVIYLICSCIGTTEASAITRVHFRNKKRRQEGEDEPESKRRKKTSIVIQEENNDETPLESTRLMEEHRKDEEVRRRKFDTVGEIEETPQRAKNIKPERRQEGQGRKREPERRKEQEKRTPTQRKKTFQERLVEVQREKDTR